MAFRWRWFLILSALILGSGQLFAAGSAKEQRAYGVAVADFQKEIWSRAEAEFAQFIQDYPKSANTPQAMLLEAQAQFRQGEFTNSIALLKKHKADAGVLGDQFAYWTGEAQFAAGNFPAAAETFVSLSQNFPDSPLRLRAVVEAAAAWAQRTNWLQAVELLQETNGVFQRAAQTDSANELVARGRLLLAQAKFAQNDFGGAAAILESVQSQALPPQLDWQRAYLLCQVKLAAGDPNGALAATTNLMQIGRLGKDDGLLATGVAFHAEVLEQLGRTDEAIAAYRENLTNAPEAQKREAILKIAELEIVQGQLTNAGEALTNFLAQFPEAISADIALLTAGELHLKDYAAAQPAATNHLTEASAVFDQFLAFFTNSPLLGKAYLDRGWCGWLAGNLTNGIADFETAVKLLPPSGDLAEARFKLGDAMFALTNYAGALENYRAVLDGFTDFTAARALTDRALYQALRACMELNDPAGASNVLAQILEQRPSSDLAPNSALLYGEGLTDAGQPAAARGVLEKFLAQWPDSPLRPEAAFAIARTWQLEQNWPAAIAGYQNWLDQFPTNHLRPQALYALAWADAQSGNEADAFGLFTNFVAQFPASNLAPLAQWWVADYFFNLGGTNYVDAERNYELVYEHFPTNELAYPARMMAGRAVVGRQDYNEAIRDYFRKLEEDTNCPTDLRVQAAFAHGSALMRMDSADTNYPLANFQLAIKVFDQIGRWDPTNEFAARAMIEIGNCNLQLTNYDGATNAYAQVVSSPAADISARSQAQICIGIALEKKAALPGVTNQVALLELALNNYLDVFDTSFGKNLRGGETADPFWVKKAGLQALLLIQGTGVSPPENFIDQMEQLLPQLKDSLEKTRAGLPPPKS